jgi:phage gp37-like protein
MSSPFQLPAVEDALIERIKQTLGSAVRAVDSLPAEFDDATLSRVLRQTPGVYVVFGGGQEPAPGGSEARMTANWLVYVITSHASGERARRRGDATTVGAYQLCETLMPALHAFTVPTIGTLFFAGLENLYDGARDNQGIAVYALTFQMNMNFPGFDAAEALAPFDLAKVTVQWPDPAPQPVAETDVQLPQ